MLLQMVVRILLEDIEKKRNKDTMETIILILKTLCFCLGLFVVLVSFVMCSLCWISVLEKGIVKTINAIVLGNELDIK